MKQIRHQTQLNIIFLSICMTLSGCATTNHVGNGIVISEQQVEHHTSHSYENTKLGATAGVASGAVTIGMPTAFFTAALTSIGTTNSVAIASAALAGAGIGGLIGGAIGLTIGAGLGYGIDTALAQENTYQFKVKPSDHSQALSITQHSRLIPLNSKVRIFEKQGQFFIRQY